MALTQETKNGKILARASSDDVTWIPLTLSPVAADRPSLGRVFELQTNWTRISYGSQ